MRSWLRRGAIKRLAAPPVEGLYIDDPEWIDRLQLELRKDEDAETLASALGDDLLGAALRVYHACRPLDAGVFHRDGLRVNDPEALAEEFRQIVGSSEALAWMRPELEALLAENEHKDRDTGRLYVCADDRLYAKDSGHYLLYGSEWVQVVLGFEGRPVLLERGAPTIVEIDLPLNVVHSSDRDAFARKLLHEWSRQVVEDDGRSPNLDFTFRLRRGVPAAWVVGHTHPVRICDPFELRRVRVNRFTDCPACRKS